MNTYIKIFISVLIVQQAAAASAMGETIRFKSSVKSYEITKNETHLRFRDNVVALKVDVKKCNKKLVDEFWASAVKKVADRRIKKSYANSRQYSSHEKLNKFGFVTYNNTNYLMGRHESSYKFLSDVPLKFNILQAKSFEQCKDKK